MQLDKKNSPFLSNYYLNYKILVIFIYSIYNMKIINFNYFLLFYKFPKICNVKSMQKIHININILYYNQIMLYSLAIAAELDGINPAAFFGFAGVTLALILASLN